MLGRTSGGIALRQRVGRGRKPAVGLLSGAGPRFPSAAHGGILQGLDAGQRGLQVMRFPLPTMQDPREASISDSWDSGVEDGEQGNLPSCS